MSIREHVSELYRIETEIRRLNKKRTELNKRKRFLEEKITGYLEEKKQPGIRYNDNVAVAMENKPKTERKKEADKRAECVAILQEYGVQKADEVIDKMKTAMKGRKIDRQTIRLIDSNKMK